MRRGRRKPRRADCEWLPLIEWVDALIRDRGPKYGQSDLANSSGISPSTLSGLVNCAHRPGFETLEKLARDAGRPLADLKRLAGYTVDTREVTDEALETLMDPTLDINRDFAKLPPDQQQTILQIMRHFRGTNKATG